MDRVLGRVAHETTPHFTEINRTPDAPLEAVEFATLEWVDWFNNRRLLSSIGDMPPAEAEARYYASLEELSIAA